MTIYQAPQIEWSIDELELPRTVNTIRKYNIRPSNPKEHSKPFVVCYDGKYKEVDSIDDGKEWVEQVNYPSVLADYGFKPVKDDLITSYFNKFTQWSSDRRIIQNGNLLTQALKLVSEMGELADNIAKGRDTKDDIGDCFVVLNNLIEMQGYTLEQCLAQAWNDIKDRKGYLNEHGVFIKEGDFKPQPLSEAST